MKKDSRDKSISRLRCGIVAWSLGVSLRVLRDRSVLRDLTAKRERHTYDKRDPSKLVFRTSNQ